MSECAGQVAGRGQGPAVSRTVDQIQGRFWLSHALLPGIAFLAAATVLEATTLDISIAGAWAFDGSSGQFAGAGAGEWWARELLHGFGGMAIRITGLVVLAGWMVSLRAPQLRAWRRPLAYLMTAALLSVAVVGLLKAVSNVDCPWSLRIFGGEMPYVHLLGDRPDFLERAHCFPGGHSGSGFSLFAGYFAWRDRDSPVARAFLWAGLLVGGLFALGQEARGAHFLSHDLWSAAIAWFAALWVYAVPYRASLWPAKPQAPGSSIPLRRRQAWYAGSAP